MFLLAAVGLFIVKSLSQIIIPIVNHLFTQNAYPAPSASAINNSIKTSFNASLPGKQTIRGLEDMSHPCVYNITVIINADVTGIQI